MERLTKCDEFGNVNIYGVSEIGLNYALSQEQQIRVKNALKKLAELEGLEEQGLLAKLPCAVGDNVYTNMSMQGWYFRKENRPYEAKVVFIGINGADNFMNVDFGNGHMLQFNFSDIGKTVFLTREQSEQALAQIQ